MLPLSHARTGSRIQAGIAAGILLLSALSAAPAFAQGHRSSQDNSMKRWVDTWFSTHPEVGRMSPAAVFADTFIASGTTYDNGKPGTVDTSFITTGQSILWRATSGFHT